MAPSNTDEAADSQQVLQEVVHHWRVVAAEAVEEGADGVEDT